MKETWHGPSLRPGEVGLNVFSSLDSAFACEDEKITSSSISQVDRVSIGDKRYYVKKYWRRGKHLRRYIGRSRARAEWENLLFFKSLDIPTPKIIAYGERSEYCGLTEKYQGVLVTEEIIDTEDLASLAYRNARQLQSPDWVKCVSKQVAEIAAHLHQHNFFHNDLKWRNLLVTKADNPVIFLIDCPTGRPIPGVLFERYRVKDIACLDKIGKQQLSRTQRLRFFKMYRDKRRLNTHDKRFLRKVTSFFAGRE